MKYNSKEPRIIKKLRWYIKPIGMKGLLNWLPDKLFLQIIFWGRTGYRLDLKNPKTFNEKLQWLKLYHRNPEYSLYADKYAVRKYISDTIGDKYLIPLIGVYNCVEEIDWSVLPNKFVLKCTHGSNANIICKDKNKLNIIEAKKKLRRWMNKNWYWFGREWIYKNIKPRIICENFISDSDKIPDDYKVLCFNGKAKVIGVHIDRFGPHYMDYYDRKWQKTTITHHREFCGGMSNFTYEKPKNFEKMLQLSELLAFGIPHVRIDWFIVRDQLYFGEITLFEGSGFVNFSNEEDDCLLGSWINLTKE